MLARLAAAAGSATDRMLFPGAAAIAALGDEHFPMPGRRRETLRTLCQHCIEREDELDIEAVAALKGVGPWTVAMVAMRGDGQPDIFPTKDLGLEKAWAGLPGPAVTLADHTANWRPWRSYAANLLWRSLSV